MADVLLKRRERADDDHARFTDAGHLIRMGILPTDVGHTNGVSLGGTRAGTATAQNAGTRRALQFLAAQ